MLSSSHRVRVMLQDDVGRSTGLGQMTIKIVTVAHVPPELEKQWLQHLRDFDIANPGCHFEVMVDAAAEKTIAEMMDTLRSIDPPLPVEFYAKRRDKDA